ncbi:hypothetical protein [Aquimarina sp. LLG6339-5]|uniref:hypothetical protein n=1 Tax=Aquimarina sp. LLG6339-5 TaxID=3160830 RepID=UPI00386D2707
MNILKHLQLTNQEGKNITGAFYENQYELWNHNRTEVTLIIDPGRVKTGLFAHNTMGRAFDEGEYYTLKVDSLLLDFNDRKLAKSYTKKFVAVAEDITAPNQKKWNISVPKPKSKEALYISFNDKIDHISAQTLIKVIQDKKEVKGEIQLSKGEKEWYFIPNKKWEKGEYQILIHPALEDICANSLNQVFDHHIKDFTQDNKQILILKFTIQ